MIEITNQFDLDTVLMEFPSLKHPPSYFTIRDAVEGIQIFGGIGSGKTSGSGATIACRYLKAGFGGLVLTVKPEKELWEHYCQQTGRLEDLIVLEPNGSHTFNFLEYESGGSDTQLSITANIVQVLKTVIRASEEKSTGKADDPFWESALDMLMSNVIDLCQLAYGKVSVQRMYDIALSAPKKSAAAGIASGEMDSKAFEQAFRRAQGNLMPVFEGWKSRYRQAELDQMEMDGTFEERLHDEIPQARLMSQVDQFFSESYRNLNDRTRSIIDFSLSGFLFRLLKEPVYSLFCNKPSTCCPEDCLEGKIILLNVPVKIYDKVGRDIQIMFKYIWQRAMERRRVTENARPVFLWADEAQNFLHEHDVEYQATARSSRIATVYLSQNLPNYHANMGGVKSEHRVKGFLGTLATKIFHANADIETNMYASELVGDAYMEDASRSTTVAGTFTATQGISVKLEKIIRPEELVSLKTGGPLNNYQTGVVIHRQGKAFTNGFNHRKMVFNQRSTS